MNSISLITKNKIDGSKINDYILKDFPFSKTVIQKDEKELFVGKYPKEFYIIYDTSHDVNGELSLLEEDDIKQIPFSPAVFVLLNFRKKEVAKYIVGKILDIYPELYIYDEESDKIISASKYIL